MLPMSVAIHHPQGLRIHKVVKHQPNSKDFNCKHCGSTFKQNSKLDHHVGLIHDKIGHNVCSECGAIFTLHYNLKRHRQSVHEDIKGYKCESCEKTFHTSNALYSHIGYAHKMQKHGCDKCVAKYFLESDLQDHIRLVHNGEKPYTCLLCKVNFSFKRSYELHLLYYHKRGGKKHAKMMKFDNFSSDPLASNYQIKKSMIHGFGMFANKRFIPRPKPFRPIAEYRGVVVKFKEAEELEKFYQHIGWQDNFIYY